MLRTWTLGFATLASLVPSAVAQTVNVSGRVVVPSNTTPCAAGQSFQVEHSDVFLQSSVVNLSALLGLDTKFTGTLLPGACNVIDVQSATAAKYVVETCGGGALGCGARVKLTSAGGGSFGLFASLSSAFAPAGPAGTFLIDLSASSLVLLVAEPATGSLSIDVVIPTDPSIIALSVRLQAVRQGASGGLEISTLDTVFTGTFTTPCFLPQC